VTAPDRAAVEATVWQVVGSILPAVPTEQIRGDKHPRELGADSVDRVEIVMTLLDQLRIDRPLSDFNDVCDLDHLVTVLLASERN
jgi:polyketide biosynthesis acyl carrier protein